MSAPSFDDALRAALLEQLGVSNIVFMKHWRKRRRVAWAGKTRKPVALMVHHTAAAATASTDPTNPGNQKGANNGVIQYVQTHFDVPAANFTLDRDGTLYVHSAFPIWHAGKGSFSKVAPFDKLGVPLNMGNDYLLGVEVMSKGLQKDFTKAQQVSLGKLAQACKDACGWHELANRLPNHRTWAPGRKIDTKYDLAQLQAWAAAQAPQTVVSHA